MLGLHIHFFSQANIKEESQELEGVGAGHVLKLKQVIKESEQTPVIYAVSVYIITISRVYSFNITRALYYYVYICIVVIYKIVFFLLAITSKCYTEFFILLLEDILH